MMTPITLSHHDPLDANYARHIIVQTETAWRQCDGLYDRHSNPALAIGHWLGREHENGELIAPSYPDHYTIDVLCETATLSFIRDEQLMYSGPANLGAVQVTAPSSRVRCTFAKPVSAVHLFVPKLAVEKLYETLEHRGLGGALQIKDPGYAPLGGIGTLASSLVDVGHLAGPFASLWLESLTIAIMARVLDVDGNAANSRSALKGLAHWRQRLAIEYIETNLGESISLKDIANHVGLSRMHFASQFKAATGLSPHIFVLNRRLAKAKELLVKDKISVIDVALEVGFRSQSHFCVAFKRSTGVTPTAWRTQRKNGIMLYANGTSSRRVDYDADRRAA